MYAKGKYYRCYHTTTNLTRKEAVSEHIENSIKLFSDNKEILEEILIKLNISNKSFLLLSKKIQKNIYSIYIYMSFLKMIKYYTNNLENEESENQDYSNQNLSNTRNIFIEFLKINNVILNQMGIKELVDGQQHDAQEYILTILDILNDSHTFELIDNIDEDILKLSDEELNKLPLDKRIIYGYKKTFHNYNKSGYTPLKTKLYFYTTQFIDCRNCKFKSISFQENSMLSLPIPDLLNNSNTTTKTITDSINSTTTIYDCLDLYFGIEVMDHEYKCENCKQKIKKNILSKKILTKPETIIIFLKRFNFNMTTMKMSKNNNLVVYPFILNLDKYFINDNNINYSLKSVICHTGVMNYGHYYSYINNNYWIKCNDDKLFKVNESNLNDEIINNNAYILFYEKIVNT